MLPIKSYEFEDTGLNVYRKLSKLFVASKLFTPVLKSSKLTEPFRLKRSLPKTYESVYFSLPRIFTLFKFKVSKGSMILDSFLKFCLFAKDLS